MHSFIAAAGLLASTLTSIVSAVPIQGPTVKSTSDSKLVAYFGQAGGQGRLNTFCDNSDIDIIPIGFVSDFPNTGNQDKLKGWPETNFGNQCGLYWKDTKMMHNCEYFVADVKYCQDKGKKILISLGGDVSIHLDNDAAGEDVADKLWAAFGPKTNSDVPRPFGENVVDGFDFDIEAGGSTGWAAAAKRLRSHMDSDGSKKYLLTAAPQCPTPDAQLSQAITEAGFDMLFVQFYNSKWCSARAGVDHTYGTEQNGGRPTDINFDSWVQIANAAKGQPQVFIGLPGSTDGVHPDNAAMYLNKQDANQLLQRFQSNPSFGGVMLWDATYAKRNNDYAGQIKDALDQLKCGKDTCETTTTTTTTKTTTTTTTSPTTTTTTTTTKSPTTTTTTTTKTTVSSTTTTTTTTTTASPTTTTTSSTTSASPTTTKTTSSTTESPTTTTTTSTTTMPVATTTTTTAVTTTSSATSSSSTTSEETTTKSTSTTTAVVVPTTSSTTSSSSTTSEAMTTKSSFTTSSAVVTTTSFTTSEQTTTTTITTTITTTTTTQDIPTTTSKSSTTDQTTTTTTTSHGNPDHTTTRSSTTSQSSTTSEEATTTSHGRPDRSTTTSESSTTEQTTTTSTYSRSMVVSSTTESSTTKSDASTSSSHSFSHASEATTSVKTSETSTTTGKRDGQTSSTSSDAEATTSSSSQSWGAWSTTSTSSAPVKSTSSSDENTWAPWTSTSSSSRPVDPTSSTSSLAEQTWAPWSTSSSKPVDPVSSSTWAPWSTTSKPVAPVSSTTWAAWTDSPSNVYVTTTTTVYTDVCPTGYTTVTATITATVTVTDVVNQPTGKDAPWPTGSAGVPTGFYATSTVCNSGCAATPVTVIVTIPVPSGTITKTVVPTASAPASAVNDKKPESDKDVATAVQAATDKPSSDGSGNAYATGVPVAGYGADNGVQGVKAFTGGAAVEQAPATAFSVAMCLALAIAGLVL